MIRFPLVFLSLYALPATAHQTGAIHAHETDYLSMVLGLTLIVAALGVAVAIRVRNR